MAVLFWILLVCVYPFTAPTGAYGSRRGLRLDLNQFVTRRSAVGWPLDVGWSSPRFPPGTPLADCREKAQFPSAYPSLLCVGLDADGALTLNGHAARRCDLAPALRGAAEAGRTLRVMIVSRPGVEYGDVVSVVDWVLAARDGVRRGPDSVGVWVALLDSRSVLPSGMVDGPWAGRKISVTREDLAGGRAAIARAIEDSRKRNRFHLVIDKTAYTLFVYRAGVLEASYAVELGAEPVLPKKREGDRRTPEGRYTVIRRREPGDTRFHRALLLNYPNETDRRAGRTGVGFEICGGGSGIRPGEGGLNWGRGRVALSDESIDRLFALGSRTERVGRGTPVTIVRYGSLPDSAYVPYR